MYICLHVVCMYVFMFVHVCVCVCVSVCVCVCIRGLSIKYVDFPYNSGSFQYFKTKSSVNLIKPFLELW